MDAKTRKHFEKHVRSLEKRAGKGDNDAAKSLACMALLVANDGPEDDGGGKIIDFTQYLMRAA